MSLKPYGLTLSRKRLHRLSHGDADRAFVARVESFLERTGVRPATLVRQAVGDPSLVRGDDDGDAERHRDRPGCGPRRAPNARRARHAPSPRLRPGEPLCAGGVAAESGHVPGDEAMGARGV